MEKNAKNEDHEKNLAALRRDILDVQKQLNLHRNQLSAIYDEQEKENREREERERMEENGRFSAKETMRSMRTNKTGESRVVGSKVNVKTTTQTVKSSIPQQQHQTSTK